MNKGLTELEKLLLSAVFTEEEIEEMDNELIYSPDSDQEELRRQIEIEAKSRSI